MDAARARMVADQLATRGIRDPDVLGAMGRVPRHLFVDSSEPYADKALPLPDAQTISQPFVVALMTEAARPATGWTDARILEVGTGSGYQAAVLAELGAEVISMERHPDLAAGARAALARAGYPGVRVLDGDGSAGFPAGAPYDAILVAAAGPRLPQPLLDQLAEGGRLVMPVGSRDQQWLTLAERHGSDWRVQRLEPVAFVPLIGQHGYGAG